MMQEHGNLGPAERWISLLSGAGLTLASLTRGRPLARGLGAVAGVSLLARAVAGHCAMKAALTGETSLREGAQKQWQRLLKGGVTTAAQDIDSMEALYIAEVQELHSAESQLCSLLQELSETLPEQTLERELRGYVTEIRTRREDLQRMLADRGIDARQHPDQAMQALVRETRKMAQVSATNLRAAALIASLQRLLHYKIAGYGTVATYAQTLGRAEDAARFAEYADRDKVVDQQLSSVAKELVNPQARIQPGEEATTQI